MSSKLRTGWMHSLSPGFSDSPDLRHLAQEQPIPGNAWRKMSCQWRKNRRKFVSTGIRMSLGIGSALGEREFT